MTHTRWLRYRLDGLDAFGTLVDDQVHEHRGDFFGDNAPTGRSVPLSRVQVLMPVQPTKVIALWNNFGQLREKLRAALPEEPLYLLKSPNSWSAHRDAIPLPRGGNGGGKVAFEGELGIVIGKRCSAATESDAMAHVFGYTCGNDVTASDILFRDASFPQWTRAKGLDGFCPLGPVVATGLDATALRVRTLLDGQVRQDYPISDMTFSVAQLVSRISLDMTLLPGDVILCGTSVGVGSMKPGSLVEVEIDGIGRLANRYG
ncbi:fumarylacetoacetate hydrolase family protein [Ideonella sp.]|uniref:fumarylacetoacetate hydrolase family protein n=1 Tax=Ideonella sp. TaxID=1929293 RepID=UPI002B4633C0|nr:fumarylacetoacetate hydrolase family protein [Ideonella sp.]HJV71437.1 fumarylacetoacetate hydrolase family protein [Ideonella sp.]